MPTTIPLGFRAANAELSYGARPTVESNDDLVVVAFFSAIGLALTIALAVLFPNEANAIAILWTT